MAFREGQSINGGMSCYPLGMKRITSVALLLSLAAPAVTVAGPYEDLQKNLSSAESVLERMEADLAEQSAEEILESQSEFFPDDGRDTGVTREEDPALAAFVSFRLNGVPYALKDVPAGAWFAPYVRDMADRSIVSGYRDGNGIPTGVFSPAKSVTLEELSKMAVEAAGIDKSSCPAEPLNPLAKGMWSAQYVSCAEAHSFALYSDGTTDIRRPATRAEVVMTILQAFGVQMIEPDPVKPLFTDVSASTLFAPAIATAVRDGIVAGYQDAQGKLTGAFGPEKPVNRAEVCKMLSIALQIYAKR